MKPGSPFPLGATWQGRGTNFALYSEAASAVDLCLFDDDGGEARVPLRQHTERIWHVFVEGIGPGQAYGYRVDGPWDPKQGLRFNPASVLLDPYAVALSGVEDWSRGAFAYDVTQAASRPEIDLARAGGDLRAAPLGLVVDRSFDWGDDAPPRVPMRSSLLYEAHVKGMTARHRDVPPEHRGTYLGLVSEAVLSHLRELGVTALVLMPVQGFIDDKSLLDRGLRNYWGQDPIAFFAPEVRYRAGRTVGSEVRQFKRMVKALHAAGIEVILDVVYDHTGEGNHLGPTFSFKGIDNATYYRLAPGDPRRYVDSPGTGNLLNLGHPQTLRLVMDSLRHWAQEMRVDGFRFHLAEALAQSLHDMGGLSTFFTVIEQDPVLGRVKLFAEPWTLGEGGSRRLPAGWAENNRKYRDTMRAFWRGDPSRAGELGLRLTGSSDLHGIDRGKPSASINFVAAHDGFTLHDVVTYGRKHNEANGEDNRDGAGDELSSSYGVEGETKDAGVRALRARQVRNLIATLFLSQGTPMIAGGDEIGRTQGGNSNAYCQDNETSWLDWELDDERTDLLEFVRRVSRLRREHPLLRRASFFRGREVEDLGVADLAWIRPDGAPMTESDWNNASTSSLGMFAAGSGLEATDEAGRAQADDDLLLLLNAGPTDLDFVLPAFTDRARAIAWEVALDTSKDDASGPLDPGSTTRLGARSLTLLSRRAMGLGGAQAVFGAPVSTYRLQLQPSFGFRAAMDALDVLDDLGVGGVYTSPYFRAQHGSTHGYDVVDPSALNAELGSEDDYRALTDAIAARSMRHIVDFVPNHVGIGSGENAWWHDVLENGPSSTFADWFDIDWQGPTRDQCDKVLLPILGRQFGEEIEEGRLHIGRDGGAFFVEYFGKRLPASLRSYGLLLERALTQVDPGQGEHVDPELESILGAVGHLPAASSTSFLDRAERRREKEIIKRRLAALCASSPKIARALDQAAASIGRSPERLEAFLGEQNYRLSYWRVAAEEINYRRFFDVNDLAAIRMEDAQVFAASHAKLFELVAEGRVSGVRLDHTDGLYDPYAYLHALQQGLGESLRRAGIGSTKPMYVIAEKILEPGETLRRTWPISGTTGYDYLAAVNGLWVDGAAEPKLTAFAAEFAGAPVDFPACLQRAKRDVMKGSFASEIHVLSESLKHIAERTRRARDFTRASLRQVIEEAIAAFRVYRTYVRPDASREKHDEARIAEAIALARRESPMIDATTFDFLRDVLLLRDRSDAAVEFAMRFQQLTGPVMAKGAEDTALYRFTRLIAQNEVGCDPSHFGTTAESFHAHNAATLAGWPLSMTTTTTHDTKRSEDVRSRIAVLSELPDEWSGFVRDVHGRSARWLTTVDGNEAPSRDDAHLFYQTVVGAFPFEGLPDAPALAAFTERIAAYMTKAAHEAKVRTSWTNPNGAYDGALDAFVRGVLGDDEIATRVEALARRLMSYGAANGLAQLALRLASPGVPDVYQGSELWNLSLVDPDNRSPVDFGHRRRLLADLRARGGASVELAKELVGAFHDGRIKLHVTRIGLRMRRETPPLFLDAAYDPIDGGEHVVAFRRTWKGRRLVCVVPRLSAKRTRGSRPWALGDVWGDASIDLANPGRFVNVFTGERLDGARLRLDAILAAFPVAWLLEV